MIAHHHPPQPPDESTAPDRRVPHVLIVEDDPPTLHLLGHSLREAGFAVLMTGSGTTALQLLQTDSNIRVVLLDLEMPGLDGFEVLTCIRNDPSTKDIAVIVQTGREDVEAIDRCFHLGATSFVMKPLNWRLLAYQIRYVLRAERWTNGGKAAA